MRLLLLGLLSCLVLGQLAAASSEMQLRGSGRLSWMWYDIYDVELHLPPGVEADPAVQPVRLTFRYLRAVSAGELAKATTTAVRKRSSAAERGDMDRDAAAINALWPSVVKGEVMTLTCRPGQGTTVGHNGRDLGTVAGDGFARVLLSIWLGDDPLDGDLRDRLLGR
jgi:hypothetical protein